MGVLKTIGRSSAMLWLGSFVAATYLRFVYWTSRWERINFETMRRFADEGRPFIGAFWHGRLLMMPFAWQGGERLYVLISRHRDGALISNTMTRFGMKSIRGSTERAGSGQDKGARAALSEMLRKMRDGAVIGFTPDGPRGPRMRASEGVAALARLSGAPVIPCTFSTRRRRVLSSWDRMVVPLPFTRGVMMFGEPITVPADAKGPALEAARLAIENAMIELTREADRRCGVDPDAILPAEAMAA